MELTTDKDMRLLYLRYPISQKPSHQLWAGRSNTIKLIAACAYRTVAGGQFDIKAWSQSFFPVLTAALTKDVA